MNNSQYPLAWHRRLDTFLIGAPLGYTWHSGRPVPPRKLVIGARKDRVTQNSRREPRPSGINSLALLRLDSCTDRIPRHISTPVGGVEAVFAKTVYDLTTDPGTYAREAHRYTDTGQPSVES